MGSMHLSSPWLGYEVIVVLLILYGRGTYSGDGIMHVRETRQQTSSCVVLWCSTVEEVAWSRKGGGKRDVAHMVSRQKVHGNGMTQGANSEHS